MVNRLYVHSIFLHNKGTQRAFLLQATFTQSHTFTRTLWWTHQGSACCLTILQRSQGSKHQPSDSWTTCSHIWTTGTSIIQQNILYSIFQFHNFSIFKFNLSKKRLQWLFFQCLLVSPLEEKWKLEITFEITISNNFTELIISVVVKLFIKVVFLKLYCNIFHKGDRLHGEKNEIQELFNIINCNNERNHHCSKEIWVRSNDYNAENRD